MAVRNFFFSFLFLFRAVDQVKERCLIAGQLCNAGMHNSKQRSDFAQPRFVSHRAHLLCQRVRVRNLVHPLAAAAFHHGIRALPLPEAQFSQSRITGCRFISSPASSHRLLERRALKAKVSVREPRRAYYRTESSRQPKTPSARSDGPILRFRFEIRSSGTGNAWCTAAPL